MVTRGMASFVRFVLSSYEIFEVITVTRVSKYGTIFFFSVIAEENKPTIK